MVILIAVPTFETIMPDTFKSLWDMDKCGHTCIFEFVRGYGIADARNRIAKRAMEIGADYVLMVDSDIIVPGDALSNLLSWDEPVVLGFYARKGRYDGETCLVKLGRVNFDYSYSALELRMARNMRDFKVEVKGGGLGCALIRTDVFGMMGYPYFDWADNGDGSSLSEDYYFCQQLALYRVPIYADARVACRHCFRHWQDIR